MKKKFLIFSLIFSIANADEFDDLIKKYPWALQNGWVSMESICNFQNDIYKRNMDCSKTLSLTEKSFTPDWVGEVTHGYYDKAKGSFPSMKLRITWRTDDSEYSCGQTITVNKTEVKDFTHRSLAMKKCL
ncbi:MAG TPA: hypothetical protein ENK66_07920 [Arcobacter sp.]|nr:hypothetical protein [Arcobacter sp.]